MFKEEGGKSKRKVEERKEKEQACPASLAFPGPLPSPAKISVSDPFCPLQLGLSRTFRNPQGTDLPRMNLHIFSETYLPSALPVDSPFTAVSQLLVRWRS